MHYFTFWNTFADHFFKGKEIKSKYISHVAIRMWLADQSSIKIEWFYSHDFEYICGFREEIGNFDSFMLLLREEGKMHLLYTTHKFIAPHWNISVTNTVLCGWLKHVLLFYLAYGKLQNSCTQQFWPRVMQTLWAHIVASTALKTSRYPLVQHITLDSVLSPSAHRHHRLKEIRHSAHCSDSLVGLHRYMGYCSSSHTLA